jgi:hypothetical protein
MKAYAFTFGFRRAISSIRDLSIAVSDRDDIERSDTISARVDLEVCQQTAEYKSHRGTVGFEGAFCDNQIRAARNSLILNTERCPSG